MTTPATVRDIDQLEDLLSDPSDAAVAALGRCRGDILVLGVGGKMGPSLARMAKRASDVAGVKRRVIGVSRFTSSQLPEQLKVWGIETIACDLLNRKDLDRLPDAELIVYMAGMKFGSTGQEAKTWAMNAYLPGMVCERFGKSKIVAFSTGNVYGLSEVKTGGAREDQSLNPIGDYAMSCLGRERILEHFSRALQIPMAVIRLNYAVELRYGVLVDIAQRVASGEEIDLSMSHFNCIWQADANAQTLAAFDHLQTPPNILNITSAECFSIRSIAEEFGKRMNKAPRFCGAEASSALVSNADKATQLFGRPRVGIDRVLDWTADWISRGGALLGKPTHFEARDGKF